MLAAVAIFVFTIVLVIWQPRGLGVGWSASLGALLALIFGVVQPGDVPVTYADTTPLEEDFGYKPATPLREGLRAFAEWYKEYYC